MQRGFTLKDFMSQLTANRNDPGKGRNMPVHYSGRNKVGAVSVACFVFQSRLWLIMYLYSMPLPLHWARKSLTPRGLHTP